MRLFALLLGILVAGNACAAAPTSASPTVRIDRVGNVLPAEVPQSTWDELTSRPVRLRSVDTGETCPITPTKELSSATGALAGSGPVYAVGNLIAYGPRTSDGLLPAKVLWVAAPDYPGAALIRGSRLDRPGGLYFSNSRAVTSLRFELDTRIRAAGSDQGWRYLPSTVDVDEPGCYGFQLDGPGWSSTIVMRALA
jgi:hypothetical protein